MPKRIFSKVMWVGRATIFGVGLAVVLAAVLGVATAALAATGANFILGKSNVATTVSKLTANIAGPALSLINTSTASGATALNLKVASGDPPLKVNSTTQVPNLNASKLDGKDASAFYAAGSKVADSSHADTADMSSDGKAVQGSVDFAGCVQHDVITYPLTVAHPSHILVSADASYNWYDPNSTSTSFSGPQVGRIWVQLVNSNGSVVAQTLPATAFADKRSDIPQYGANVDLSSGGLLLDPSAWTSYNVAAGNYTLKLVADSSGNCSGTGHLWYPNVSDVILPVAGS